MELYNSMYPRCVFTQLETAGEHVFLNLGIRAWCFVKAVFSFYENLQEKYIDSLFSSLQQLFQVFDFTEKNRLLATSYWEVTWQYGYT